MPILDDLESEVPNFHEVIFEIKRRLALVLESSDPLELDPILLLGPAGIGKTHFGRKVAELLGTGFSFTSLASSTAGWILSGASSQWRGARAGKVFQTLFDHDYINPLMMLDEIDKARGEHAYDPLGALYGLLEKDTAAHFVDEFVEVPIDASRIIWFATANDERSIPSPIMSRFTPFEIGLTVDQARGIGERLYRSYIRDYDWGKRFDPNPSSDVLDVLARVVPREMRNDLKSAFGSAKLEHRYTLEPRDFPPPNKRKRSMGFH
jgi:ATP-dependent Lon protease